MSNDRLAALLKADLSRFANLDDSSRLFSVWLKLFHPRFFPVLLLRIAHACNKYTLIKPFAFLFTFLNQIFFGIEVTPKCKIGAGIFLPHTVGTVLGASEIGVNVTIFQGVTVGAKFADLNYDLSTRPLIGDGVIIGAGAKVLGPIKIGNNAIIAANSLVTENVEEGAFMIGVPAIRRIRDELQ